jgi:hypothetical protein
MSSCNNGNSTNYDLIISEANKYIKEYEKNRIKNPSYSSDYFSSFVVSSNGVPSVYYGDSNYMSIENVLNSN